MMRALGIVVACLAVVVGGLVVWYNIAYPTYTYRYRMTVEVLVDGQIKSGSSVIEVSVDKQPKIGSAPPQVSRVNGEAVFVDLGGGKNLIALLASGPDAKDVDYPYNIIPTLFHLTLDDRDLVKFPSLRGARYVPGGYMPTFVTFANIGDARSARVIGPEEFETTFGPGTHLRAVKVEMTEEPVTHVIEEKMPSIIATLRSDAKISRSEGIGDPFRVNLGHFVR